MTILSDVKALGQQIWLDNLSRSLIQSGELAKMLQQGVCGVTSNPAIFQKAFAGDALYADEIAALKQQNLTAKQRYETLAIADVQAACDQGLKGAKQRVAQLEKRKLDAGWLSAFDDLTVYFEDHQGPVDFVLNVHPDKAVRDAAQACSLRWADFSSSLGQNEKLYRALQKAPRKDAIDAELVRLASGQFEDSGVALPKAKRERA